MIKKAKKEENTEVGRSDVKTTFPIIYVAHSPTSIMRINQGGLALSHVGREVLLPHHPLSTYHRRVSEEPSLLYLVSPLLVVVGILGLFSLSWAISTRPSWWQVRNELYGLLLFAGTVAVFIAFSFLALNYLPGPDWFWFLVGFVGHFWMCFLIHEKFGSSRI